jgi:hypothetical protein
VRLPAPPLLKVAVAPWLNRLLGEKLAPLSAGRVLYLGKATDLPRLGLRSALAVAPDQASGGGVRARAEALPFAAGVFDLVVRAGLGGGPLEALVTGAGRVLKDDGCLVVVVPVSDRLGGRVLGALGQKVPHAHDLTRLFMLEGFVDVEQEWAPSPWPAVATLGRMRRLGSRPARH